MENQNRSTKTVVVWRFMDGKPGHEKQTAGLIHNLKQQTDVKLVTLNCRSRIKNLIEILFKKYKRGAKLPKPDILLGAGHATHLEIIAAQRKFGGKSVIIMKPTLPYCMFDLCLVPKHDRPPERKNIIVSEMPLPPLDSSRRINENLGVFLIGGPSRHFKWSDQIIADKIENIVRHNSKSEIKWKLTTSRRTPISFLSEMKKINLGNLEVIEYRDTPTDWVENQLRVCGQVWVTQDSYSMICEAVNACGKVGVLELNDKHAFISHKRKKFSELPHKNLTTFSSWIVSKKFQKCDILDDTQGMLGRNVLTHLGLHELI